MRSLISHTRERGNIYMASDIWDRENFDLCNAS